jgi:hypothetical protein
LIFIVEGKRGERQKETVQEEHVAVARDMRASCPGSGGDRGSTAGEETEEGNARLGEKHTNNPAPMEMEEDVLLRSGVVWWEERWLAGWG